MPYTRSSTKSSVRQRTSGFVYGPTGGVATGPLADQLVSHWGLDTNVSKAAGTHPDSHGTNDLDESADWASVAGLVGNAPYTVNASYYMDDGGVGTYDFGQDWTMAGHFRDPIATAPASGLVWHHSVASPTAGGQEADFAWRLYYDSAVGSFGQWKFSANVAGVEDTVVTALQPETMSFNWTHVAFGVEQSTYKLWLAINGSVSEQTSLGTTAFDTSDYLRVGQNGNGGTGIYVGTIRVQYDLWGVWQRRLSAAELALHSNSNLGLSYSDMLIAQL